MWRCVNNFYYKFIGYIYPNKDLDMMLDALRDVLPVHMCIDHLELGNDKVINTISLTDYSNKRIRQMIWTLKYQGDHRVVKLFAQVLLEYLLESLSENNEIEPGKKMLIIPIPLHKLRIKERGFNQLQLVLDVVSKNSDSLSKFIEYNILLKAKHTKSQTHLKRKDRLKNVTKAFKILNTNPVQGSHVILIDDVLTTGATVSEASKELLKAGASIVEVVTLSRAI